MTAILSTKSSRTQGNASNEVVRLESSGDKSKIKFGTVYQTNQTNKDTNGQPLVNNELWRSTKSLESPLFTEKDIAEWW
jgi:hypothetical protein